MYAIYYTYLSNQITSQQYHQKDDISEKYRHVGLTDSEGSDFAAWTLE